VGVSIHATRRDCSLNPLVVTAGSLLARATPIFKRTLPEPSSKLFLRWLGTVGYTNPTMKDCGPNPLALTEL
jgi:hypothetical protein